LHAGGVAESKCDVRFAKADIADEDDVGLAWDKGQTEQVLDLRSVDFFWPVPAEVLERFYDGEARAFLMRRSIARFSRTVASPSISCARYSRWESCSWAALVAKA
jgi:hypothetical protein